MGQVDFWVSVGSDASRLGVTRIRQRARAGGALRCAELRRGGALSWGDDRLENALSRAREGRLAAV